MVEALVKALSSARYNLVVEGTLRTSQVPLDTAALLRGKGYRVSLALMAVKPEISLVSCQIRYELMRMAGTTPRATDPAHHNKIVADIVQNLGVLRARGCSTRFGSTRAKGSSCTRLRGMRAAPPTCSRRCSSARGLIRKESTTSSWRQSSPRCKEGLPSRRIGRRITRAGDGPRGRPKVHEVGRREAPRPPGTAQGSPGLRRGRRGDAPRFPRVALVSSRTW